MQAAKQTKEKQQQAKLQPEAQKQQQMDKAAAAAAAVDNDDADDDISEPVCSTQRFSQPLQFGLKWLYFYVST